MKRITIILALSLALPLAACGDDGDGGDAGVGDPPVPTLGAQQDRAGRPAITAAAIAAFPFLGGPDKAEYNADGNVAGWIAAYQPTIQAHVAIYDSLDTATVVGGGCNMTDNPGNVLRNLPGDDPANPAPPYVVLATVLADDRLYIDSTLSTCGDGGYLAVEANSALGAPQNDCGGRTPTMDVVDTSYTALATGLQSPVGDGVAMDADGAPPVATFPFLNEPSGN